MYQSFRPGPYGTGFADYKKIEKDERWKGGLLQNIVTKQKTSKKIFGRPKNLFGRPKTFLDVQFFFGRPTKFFGRPIFWFKLLSQLVN